MSKKYVIGIDIGGSTTKIVAFDEEKKIVDPMFVHAEDQLTSIYGAFGKFTSENKIDLSQIKKIMLTGVGATYITSPLYNILAIRSLNSLASVGEDSTSRDSMRRSL